MHGLQAPWSQVTSARGLAETGSREGGEAAENYPDLLNHEWHHSRGTSARSADCVHNPGVIGVDGQIRAAVEYQMDAYRYWEAQLGRKDFSFGQFGENFTVDGLADDEVCIGDRYRIGSALFEVTQPRVTCYRVGIRMAEPAMPALLVSHHRPGFYFRVLEEGEVGAGDEIKKVADGPERITVANMDALLYLPNPSREQLERSLRVPALSPGWKTSLKALVEGNPGLKASTGPPPAWPGFRPVHVTRLERESVNVL